MLAVGECQIRSPRSASRRGSTQDLSRYVGCAVDESDEEPLIRLPRSQIVVPRIVASVPDVTQIDIAHVEDHSAVSPTLLDSLVEDLSEALPHSNLRDAGRIGVQILPSDD